MKGFGEKNEHPKKKKSNSNEQIIKDQILSKAFKQHFQGNLQEAKNNCCLNRRKNFIQR